MFRIEQLQRRATKAGGDGLHQVDEGRRLDHGRGLVAIAQVQDMGQGKGRGTMKPYYQDSACTIFHGDCREILPQLPKVDLVLTDPPYGIGRDGSKFSTGPTGGGRKAYEFLGWDKMRPPKEIFDLIFLVSSSQIIWGGNYFCDILPPTMRWLVWDKGQRIAQSDGELAWTSEQKALRIFTENRMAIQQDGAVHPTQKPESLFKWCLNFFPEAKTILDPFMGSGTTLRAAKDLGRKAIGIEIEEKYCEIAVRRLKQEVLSLAPTRQEAEGIGTNRGAQ